MKLVASLAILVVAMCSMPARLAAADDPKRAVPGGGEVIVGRVMFVDPRAGTVVVEFPSGPQRLNPDHRDLDRFVFYQGKDLVFDSQLRPQWDAPLPAPREPARPR